MMRSLNKLLVYIIVLQVLEFIFVSYHNWFHQFIGFIPIR